MGFYSDQILSYTAADAELDARDGLPAFTPRYASIDPIVAQAAPFRTDTYAIYHSIGGDWTKRHSGCFATYEAALRALTRLGWLHGNGMHHCIVPAVAETLPHAIGLELLYGRVG